MLAGTTIGLPNPHEQCIVYALVFLLYIKFYLVHAMSTITMVWVAGISEFHLYEWLLSAVKSLRFVLLISAMQLQQLLVLKAN